MPTENPSNNEMVSDSEMTECQFHNNCGGWCETRRELEHNLCEHCLEAHDEEMEVPAEQHQGEPVALPERKAFTIEDYNRGDGATSGWNACLDEIAKLGPLYPRPAPADPGEVERLRAEIRSLRQHKTDYMEAAEETRKALLAQLAERDALLGPIAGWTAETREAVLEAFQDELNESASYAWYDAAIADLMKLVEAVSASAEPSAPVERDERAAYDAWRHSESGYVRPFDRHEWSAWQARAALERKP